MWLNAEATDSDHTDLLKRSGIPDPGSTGRMPTSTWVNTDSGVILTKFRTANWRDGGQTQLWVIPPGTIGMLVKSERFAAGDNGYPCPEVDALAQAIRDGDEHPPLRL